VSERAVDRTRSAQKGRPGFAKDCFMTRNFFHDASIESGPVYRRVFRKLIKNRGLVLGVATLLISSALSFPVAAASLPSGFVETTFATGLSSPTAMDFAPDGRLFVCLQGGTLRVIKNGALLPTPFLTLTVDSAGERGLLGIAFDPNFATNNFCTSTTPCQDQSRTIASAASQPMVMSRPQTAK